MNRLLRGSIAGAAGIALLLGGAGTFALWNSSANVAGGTITAGTLTIAPSTTAGSWTANGVAVADIADYTIVPGDSLVYTQKMSIVATGDNLVATLDIAAASVEATSTSPADVALASFIDESAVLTATGTAITGSAAPFTVTAGTAGVAQDVTVTVSIDFTNGAAGVENAAQLGSVDLESLAVSLTQK